MCYDLQFLHSLIRLHSITCPREQLCIHQTGWWGEAKVLHVTAGVCLVLRLLLALASTTNVLALILQHLIFPRACRRHKISFWRYLLGGIPISAGWWCKWEGSLPHCRGKGVWGLWCVSHSWLIPVFLSSSYPSCTITASARPLCHSSKLTKALKIMQLTCETSRDEARLDLVEEYVLLSWSSGFFLLGNCKKKTHHAQEGNLKACLKTLH